MADLHVPIRAGADIAFLRRVFELLTANSGRDRTGAFVHSVGWTQHMARSPRSARSACAEAFAFDRSVRKSLACRASGCPDLPGLGPPAARRPHAGDARAVNYAVTACFWSLLVTWMLRGLAASCTGMVRVRTPAA